MRSPSCLRCTCRRRARCRGKSCCRSLGGEKQNKTKLSYDKKIGRLWAFFKSWKHLLVPFLAPGRDQRFEVLRNFPTGDHGVELPVLGLDVLDQVEATQEAGDVPVFPGAVAGTGVGAEAFMAQGRKELID